MLAVGVMSGAIVEGCQMGTTTGRKQDGVGQLEVARWGLQQEGSRRVWGNWRRWWGSAQLIAVSGHLKRVLGPACSSAAAWLCVCPYRSLIGSSVSVSLGFSAAARLPLQLAQTFPDVILI